MDRLNIDISRVTPVHMCAHTVVLQSARVSDFVNRLELLDTLPSFVHENVNSDLQNMGSSHAKPNLRHDDSFYLTFFVIQECISF